MVFITQLIKYLFFAMVLRRSGAEHIIVLHFQPYNPYINPDNVLNTCCCSEQSTLGKDSRDL